METNRNMNFFEMMNHVVCVAILVCTLHTLAIQIQEDQMQMVKQANIRRKWKDIVKQIMSKNERQIRSVDPPTTVGIFGTIANPLRAVMVPVRIMFPSLYRCENDQYII